MWWINLEVSSQWCSSSCSALVRKRLFQEEYRQTNSDQYISTNAVALVNALIDHTVLFCYFCVSDVAANDGFPGFQLCGCVLMKWQGFYKYTHEVSVMHVHTESLRLHSVKGTFQECVWRGAVGHRAWIVRTAHSLWLPSSCARAAALGILGPGRLCVCVWVCVCEYMCICFLVWVFIGLCHPSAAAAVLSTWFLTWTLLVERIRGEKTLIIQFEKLF